jgi:hypothetical protein
MIEHRGYQVMQSDHNNHISIAKDGKVICFASVAKKLNEEELKKTVDEILIMKEGMK